MRSARKLVKETRIIGGCSLHISEGPRALRAHKAIARGKNDYGLTKCERSLACSKIFIPQKVDRSSKTRYFSCTRNYG
jgi:hypothetical protein